MYGNWMATEIPELLLTSRGFSEKYAVRQDSHNALEIQCSAAGYLAIELLSFSEPGADMQGCLKKY